MKRTLVLLLPVLLWSGVATAVEFRGWRLDVTESLYVNYNQTMNDSLGHSEGFSFLDIKNRLNFQLSSHWLVAGLRLDGAWFAPLSEDPELKPVFEQRYDNHLTVEKAYLALRQSNYVAELGDFYATFGKGIVLSVKKVDELSTDTTIRGAKAIVRDSLYTVTVLGGTTNITNVGDLLLEKYPDPNDFVAGAEAQLRPLSWLHLSTHGVLYNFNTNWDNVASGGDHHRKDLTLMGGTLQVPDLFGVLSLNVEYDYQVNHEMAYGSEAGGLLLTYDERRQDGHAIYASVNGNYSVFTLLAEFKYYDGFEVENTGFVGTSVASPAGTEQTVYYSSLPPLEDPDLFWRADFYDQWGFRVRLDGEIPSSGTILFASYSHTDELDPEDFGPDLDASSRVRHVLGGAEQRVDDWALTARLFGGYRLEKEELKHDRTMFHVDGDVQFPISGAHSLEMHGRMERYHEEVMPKDEFTIAQSTLTYSFAPFLSLACTYEYTTEDTIGADRNHFVSGEALWRFASSSYLKLMYGSTRGGLRCSGGMCRQFPAFEGGRAEITVRF